MQEQSQLHYLISIVEVMILNHRAYELTIRKDSLYTGQRLK